MPNVVINPSVIAKLMMVEFKNAMVLGGLVNRDYEAEFGREVNGHKVGDTVMYKRPVAYAAVDGPDISAADKSTTEGKDTIQLNFHKTVPLEFSVRERTVDINDFTTRYIRPASIELAQQVEGAVAGCYSDMYWFSGTPGTVPSTFLELGAIGNILTNAAVPMNDRVAIHDPDAALKLADGLRTTFIQSSGKTLTALEEQKIGRYARFDNYESVSLIRHLVGDHGGTPLVNGANQGVSYTTEAVRNSMTQTLITDGWTANKTNLLRKGDVFTIAGVNAVNPKTRQSTGKLQTFVVIAAANSDGSGNSTLTIRPAIIPVAGASAASLPYATVDTAPADNAAITVKTGAANQSYGQSIAMHKRAVSLVMRPFEKPDSAVVWEQPSIDGLTLTLAKGFDVSRYTETTRLDCLFGVKVTDPRLCGRLTS